MSNKEFKFECDKLTVYFVFALVTIMALGIPVYFTVTEIYRVLIGMKLKYLHSIKDLILIDILMGSMFFVLLHEMFNDIRIEMNELFIMKKGIFKIKKIYWKDVKEIRYNGIVMFILSKDKSKIGINRVKHKNWEEGFLFIEKILDNKKLR